MQSYCKEDIRRDFLDENRLIKLHLGCGSRRIKGMLNCDYRETNATDIVIDCTNLTEFKNNSVNLIFSNAFFEHLYRDQHLTHLKNCFRILCDDAPLIYLGIPDFQIIAEAYLQQKPGIVGERFDIYNVYRYTHGDPEQAPDWWLQQLHKAIFDKYYVSEILTNSGFRSYTIFNYCYPNENIPLNIGFIAWKSRTLKENAELLEPFSEYMTDVTESFNSMIRN